MKSAIESALEERNLKLAHNLFQAEWDRVADPALFYYQVIRDGLVNTFRYLESSGLCPEWDSFRHCSNALLELDVKNVSIAEEMEILVTYKLSVYGLRHLCGDPEKAKPQNSWIESIDRVVGWVQELSSRPRWYDYLDVDDGVLFRLRMIHNHLFFVKDHAAVRELPLKELIFCLAIFVRVHDNFPGEEVYRVIVNKRNVMQFLRAIVRRLKAISDGSSSVKHLKSSVLNKLRKTYRRVKQLYSVFKVVRCVQIYREFGSEDFKRCNASVTVTAFKRFNQICGEAIKNTVDTPNLSKKLNTLLPQILTDSILLNSQYRNVSSHGIPLSHLFVRDCDQLYYYEKLSDYIYITAVSFYIVCVYLLHDCTRYIYGLMRRSRTIDDLRSLIRYSGGNTIKSLQEVMFHRIEQYLATVRSRLSETDPNQLSTVQKEEYDDLWDNYYEKEKSIEQLKNSHRNMLIETAELLAFTESSITAVHRLLDSKLTDTSSGSFFETMFGDWKILTTASFDSTEFNAVVMQSYIHQFQELKHDSTEQWRYREKTAQILDHFISNLNLDASTIDLLEENLHKALSKPRNGYYQDIFALDSKSQAISQTLKTSIVGPKTSADFRCKNSKFKSKMEDMRQHDQHELTMVFRKIVLNLQEVFTRNECETIANFTSNIGKISLKDRLAVEYWQLQAMEMLYSGGYLGDNFSLFTRFVPIIWGKSYRNYLAHDSISYDVLTACGSSKILMNGFVLAFHASELEIFRPAQKFTLDGLVVLETEGFIRLKQQENLLESLKTGNASEWNACLARKAEPLGRYLISLGHLLRPRYFTLPGIMSHEQLDLFNLETIILLLKDYFPNIREILTVYKINYASKLNLLQFYSSFPIQQAIQQFENLQPRLMTPCIGVLLPMLLKQNNFELLEALIDRRAGGNTKTILLMSSRHPEIERYYPEIRHPTIISELNEHDLNELFSEDYPASSYELGIAILRNDLRLFKHIVDRWYLSESSDLSESDLLEAMENCCYRGRCEMVSYLMEKGLLCDLFSLSRYLTLAIHGHHWKVVNLLLQNDAYEWLDDGVNVLSLITERNFRILRPILAENIPDHLEEKLARHVVQLGSLRLLKDLRRSGWDILKSGQILSDAALNEDLRVLEYVESEIFPSLEHLSNYAGMKFWMKIFQDLEVLMRTAIDSEFIFTIMQKTSVAERWIERLSDLLMLDDDRFGDLFHFEDSSELFCFVLPDNYFRAFDAQFRKTLEKCETFKSLVQSLPQNLFVSDAIASIVFHSPFKQVVTIIKLTIYSSIDSPSIVNESSTIKTQDLYHTADIISDGLRTYLLKFRHLQAATASVTVAHSSKQFFFIQINSSTCIVRQCPRTLCKLSFMLNRPKMDGILHYIRPTTTPRTVETLLRLGANPATQDNKLRTAFHVLFVQPFPLELIELMYRWNLQYNLVEEPHVFNMKAEDGYTALHVAVGANNYDIVKFMLENGADPTLADQTGGAAVLCYAILNRNVRIVELLIRKSPALVRDLNNSVLQTTALDNAVRINHEYIVQLLLENGADLKHRNRDGCTALKYAVEQESVESLQVMLEYALRERILLDDSVDGFGRTRMQFAREKGVCQGVMQALVCYSIKSMFRDLQELMRKKGL